MHLHLLQDRSRRLPQRLQTPAAWQTLYDVLGPERFIAEARRRYGDVFTLRILGEPVVVLGDPEAVSDIFACGYDDIDSGAANKALAPILGAENLLLLDSCEHRHRRRLISPSFHGEAMRAYEHFIRERAAREIAEWPVGIPTAVLPRMQSLTLSIMLRCVFGLDDPARERAVGIALERVLKAVTDRRRVLLYFLVGGPALFRSDRLMIASGVRRHLDTLDREVLAEITLRRTMTDLHQRRDVLSLLILARDAEGQPISDSALRDELIMLLIAGMETSAAVLAWAAHELARDRLSQDRLAAGPSSYTDAVLIETMRLRPPIPVVGRRLKRPLYVAGHVLPAGTIVRPSQLLVQRRSDLYPAPWSFNPDRFLDRRPSANTWFPFGGGIRRCIGAAFAQFEAAIVLEALSRAFVLSPARRGTEAAIRRGIVLVPTHGAEVVATPR